MIDLECVGCTPEFLKGRFEADPAKRTGTQEEKDKVDVLLNRIRSRIQEGMSRNLNDWHWIYAIDKALDTPFRQFYPRLFGSLDSGDLQTCCNVLQGLNLGNCVTKTKGADGKDAYAVNEENFVILVGLCTSYLKARWAKLMNDRRLSPLLRYEPAKMTTINRTKCEVITDRIQVMADQFSYFDVWKQAAFKMLAYSYSIRFIKEEWYTEEQEKYADADDVERKGKKEDGTNKIKEGDKIKVIVKEGLRYDIPKPNHTYRDLAHGLYTINSDTGCMFGGHWQIVRYRDVKNAGFWNDDKVSLGNGTNPLVDYSSYYFQIYDNAIKVAPPCKPTAEETVPGMVGSTSTDLQAALANQWYNTDHLDQGTLLTYHFEKLVPKDNGLGDYEHPVWFRFVLAGDGCTPLWAAALPASPMIYDGYDADESRAKNASLVMEILPYQYQFETALSQIILSNRQNLSNLTLLNTDVLDTKKDWVAEIAGWGSAIWKKLNIVPASFKTLNRLMQNNSRSQQDMGISLTLPKANIQEQIAVAQFILATLERALGMSNQEIAQTASHEISATETRNLAAATTSRLTFTGTAMDIGRDAWKRQLYCYTMAFGDDDFYGHIPADNTITKEQLDALGFTYVDHDEMAGSEKYRRVRAKKSSLALPLYEFASTRDGEDRSNDSAIAAVMATLVRDLMNNPMMAAAIGPEQGIALANAIAYFAGLPRDFKLRFTGQTVDQQKEEMQAQLKQVVEATLAAADQHILKAITPLLEEVKALKMEVAILMRYTGLAPGPSMGQPPMGNGAPPPMAPQPMAPMMPPDRMMAPPPMEMAPPGM